MKRTCKKPLLVLIICLVIFSAMEIPSGFFRTKLFLLLAPDDSLVMHFSIYPEGYTTFCADGVSPILLDVSLFDSNQNPIPFSSIHVRLNNSSVRMKPSHPITDKDGRAIITLFPEELNQFGEDGEDFHSEISVCLELNAYKATPVRWEGRMATPPVVLIHGFQDTSEAMVPLHNYLLDKGFQVYSLDYATDTDLETMSDALDKFLASTTLDLKEKGIHAGRMDLVAHSLGGIVARFYTSQTTYLQKQNVHKLIFINVPHFGTPWAEAGAALLNTPFLTELYPTSELYTSVFPNFINRGLNQNIQTANIALENDEVVPLPSSTLSSWGIDTKVYRIGSEPLSLESVISNQVTGVSRHRQLLFYTPVFEEIFDYLTNSLPYPQKKK